MTQTTLPLRACPCCGLVQAVPAVPARHVASCPRCSAAVSAPGKWSRSAVRTFSASLAALVLYPLALFLPIMEIQRFGHRTEASIWTGSVGLLSDGHVFIGSVVLLCSVVLPLGKLGSLLLITAPGSGLHPHHRVLTWRIVEFTGRWGMLDVLLVSVVVAWIKIGDLVDVTAGPAALAFTICVLLSLFASAWFDPHALWNEEDPR